MNPKHLDIHVPSECSWELVCTCILAIHSAFRRGWPLVITQWFLPSGWLARLEASLYIAYHQLEDAGAAVFLEKEEYYSSHDQLFVSSRGLRKLPIRNASELAELLYGKAAVADDFVQRLSVNHKHLEAWRNHYAGKRAFIIGNGPSLTRTDLRLLSSELTFGSNALFLLDRYYHFRPTFYVVEDRLIAEDRADQIRAYRGPIKFFPWDQEPILEGNAYLPLVRSYTPYPQFSPDIGGVVFTGWTVTFLLLQLAFYMGIRNVFLIGVDGTYPRVSNAIDSCVIVSTDADANHFAPDYFGPGRRYHQPQPLRVNQAYMLAREYFRSAGGEIWNATVGGELDVFPRVNIVEVLETRSDIG